MLMKKKKRELHQQELKYYAGEKATEESTEESTDESTVGENEDYLDVEELILYLIKIKKSKRITELLVSELFELIKNKA